MESEDERGEERAGWKNGGQDGGPNCCIGHWRERERERGRERERRERKGERERERGGEVKRRRERGRRSERVRSGDRRRGKSLLESAGASASVPSSVSPAERSAAFYKPSYTPLLGSGERAT